MKRRRARPDAGGVTARILTLASLLALAAILLAACGGAREEAAAPPEIGDATIAASSPTDAMRGGEEDGDGIAYGEPVLPEAVPPAVGLADKQARCGGTDLAPSGANVHDVRAAILCLLNAERAARNMAALRPHGLLARAAVAHAADMVRNTYFAHDSRDGTSFAKRIERTGYLRTAVRWTVGENLAWGSGTFARPADIVQAWMESPGHRANILNREFREIGIGISLGVPVGPGGDGATYGTSFGTRFFR